MNTDRPTNDQTGELPDDDPSRKVWQPLGGTLAEALIGKNIGPYRILSILGEGGFGVVYLAERHEPHVQRVALKVIKPGMDTKHVIARFEQERQALALMDHPCVARIYDAGATEEGRPYFVMEYVKGEPITTFCDRHRVSLDERLTLFMRVCEAVQHAHQKGLIHRDLSPGNILVTYEDNKPVPKVIDFGVAKAIDHTLTEASVFTEEGHLIGKPEYMSPEQAEMSRLDIDTRADIYSLGVVLYELLTGLLPFDRQSLRAAGFAEIHRIIREEDPPKPSTRLSTLSATEADRLRELARKRHAEVRSLTRGLRNDLDWIVMKCLEKDRTRRYDTASALAMDLKRHLASEPVSAGPPSAIYRMRKFTRRHRMGVSIAAAITLAVLGGLVAAWQTSAARASIAEREVAEARAERAAAEAEAQRAEAELRASNLRNLVQVMLIDLHAAIAKLEGATLAREMIVTTALEYLRELSESPDYADDPLLRLELARAYESVGDIQFALRGPAIGDTAGALASYQEGLSLRESVTDQFDGDHAFLRDLSSSRTRVGDVLVRMGDLSAAEEHYREALDIRENLLRADPASVRARRDLSIALNNLGSILRHDQPDIAEQHYRRSADLMRSVIAERPDDLDLLRDLSVSIVRVADRRRHAGDLDAALEHYQEALDARRRISELEPDSVRARRDVAVVQYLMAQAHLAANETENALEHMNDVINYATTAAEEDPHDARSQRDLSLFFGALGDVLIELNRLDEAAQHYREFYDSAMQLTRDDPENINAHRMVANAVESLAKVNALRDRTADAIAGYRQALTLSDALVDRSPDDVRLVLEKTRRQTMLAELLLTDDPDAAGELIAEALATCERLEESLAEQAAFKSIYERVLAVQSQLNSRTGNGEA